MSTSSFRGTYFSPIGILLRLGLIAGIVVLLSYTMVSAAKLLGMGDRFKHACAHEGYQQVMDRGAGIITIGASDAVAVDPNLVGIDAGIVVLRGAGLDSLLTAVDFLRERESHLEKIYLVINPINLVTDRSAGLSRMSDRFESEFDVWLFQQNPSEYWGPSLRRLLNTDVWQSTLISTRDLNIGNARQRCQEIATRNGVQLIIEERVDPEVSSAEEGVRHGRLVPASPATRASVLNDNLDQVVKSIDMTRAEGVALTIVLPPLHPTYRRILSLDDIVSAAMTRLGPNGVDMTADFDDRTGFFRDANHLEWPEGSSLSTARLFEQSK